MAGRATGAALALGVVLHAFAPAAVAGQMEAAEAVARILFETDMDNASYKVRPDGFVDISFGADVPDNRYAEVVQKLRADPAIAGVLAGKGTANFCPRL